MIYTGKCKVKSDRLEAFLLVAKELKVSSVEDWKVDEHGVEPIEEDVEDGECVEQEEEEERYKRRKTTRKKVGKKRKTKKMLTATESNRQENGQIVKQRHVSKKSKDLKPNWLSFESRARNGDFLPVRTNELSKRELQHKKNIPRTVKIILTEKGNEVVIPKSTFNCQAQADSRNGGELKCKFCGIFSVSKGTLSYHMTAEQCL